jgi:uncharacterized membrane protein
MSLSRTSEQPSPTPPASAALEETGSGEVPRSAGLGAWFLLAVGVVGLGVSVYLTTLHYAGVQPICTSGGFVNCQGVLKSQYSFVPGTSVPVTVPGMIWFIASGVLAAIAIRCARRGLPEPSWLRPAHVVWAVLGLASVLYFVWAELVQLHELCEWCTSVHVLVFLSLLVTLARLQSGGATAAPDSP